DATRQSGCRKASGAPFWGFRLAPPPRPDPPNSHLDGRYRASASPRVGGGLGRERAALGERGAWRAGGRCSRPYTAGMAVYADLVRYRELFANLFRRDFHAKYRGSALGIVWSLVNPAAVLVVYLIVFGIILDKSGGIPHYWLYLLAGIACWTFFAVSLQAAARSLVESADLIRKVRFPRQ